MLSKSFIKPLSAFVAGAALLGGAFLHGRAATGVHTLAPAPYLPAQSQSQSPLVWVNTRTCVYHYPGSRWYGVTQEGKYVTKAQAVAEGDRPSLRE